MEAADFNPFVTKGFWYVEPIQQIEFSLPLRWSLFTVSANTVVPYAKNINKCTVST